MGHVGHAGEQRTLEAGTFETEWNVFSDENIKPPKTFRFV
jgi:hypothetical protein